VGDSRLVGPEVFLDIHRNPERAPREIETIPRQAYVDFHSQYYNSNLAIIQTLTCCGLFMEVMSMAQMLLMS